MLSVDNIFENDGDAGFWVALANLTKKAMCPIILTSTAAPVLLDASSIRYQSACMTRPSPLECALKMRRIAKEEALRLRIDDHGDDEWSINQLRRIAELCNCDLRSILNEMQLHSHGVSLVPQEEGKSITDTVPDASSPPSIMDSPAINDITPRFVCATSYNVLTIRGDNFARLTGLALTEVLIGGRVSPALRIIDDKTILAVCPPCTLPKDVDSSGSFEDSFEPCISCRYAPVVVKITMKTGIVLHSDSCMYSEVNSFGRRFNIAFTFPELEGRLERICRRRENARNLRLEGCLDALSSGDDDFVIPTTRSKENGKDATVTSGREITNVVSMVSEPTEEQLTSGDEVADSLLENAVTEFFPGLKSSDQVQRVVVEGKVCGDGERDLSKLQKLAKDVEYSSDAALLEDSLSSLAIPTIAGAVRGFGSEFIDSESLSENPFPGTSSKKLRHAGAKL